MRTIKLILSDIHFQFKYGFYFLYVVFTAFYMAALYFVPPEWKKGVASILIFSDPAAIGMFFMGAIVLLEKSQRVLNFIAISPVKVEEYILGKVVSIGIISVIVGLAIGASVNTGNYQYVVLGVLLSSILFSLIGIIIAFRINSLNKFIIATVPFQMLITVPPVLMMFGVDGANITIHPGICAVKLIQGDVKEPLILIGVLILWIILAGVICIRTVKKGFVELGGVKL